jgi:hypothetical protein
VANTLGDHRVCEVLWMDYRNQVLMPFRIKRKAKRPKRLQAQEIHWFDAPAKEFHRRLIRTGTPNVAVYKDTSHHCWIDTWGTFEIRA